MSRFPRRVGGTPVAELPAQARYFAELPYDEVTEKVRRYHLATYETWCAKHKVEAWPPTLQRLLDYAADRAQDYAYYTVREHVRIVTMVERARSGRDYFTDIRLQTVLKGIRHERPPQPVQPIARADFQKIIDFKPSTWVQEGERMMAILTYCAGFRNEEIRAARVEFVKTFKDCAILESEAMRRQRICIKRGKDPMSCPVANLERWIAFLDRTESPLFPIRLPTGAIGWTSCGYGSLEDKFARLGRNCGLAPLSMDRVRQGGIVEQARHVEPTVLAGFHGFNKMTSLAEFLDIHMDRPGNYAFERPGHRRE